MLADLRAAYINKTSTVSSCVAKLLVNGLTLISWDHKWEIKLSNYQRTCQTSWDILLEIFLWQGQISYGTIE